MIHRWINPETGTPWNTGNAHAEYASAATREVLRLVQREADLLATLEHVKVQVVNADAFQVTFTGKLIADRQALEKERDGLALRVANQERQIAAMEQDATAAKRNMESLRDHLTGRGARIEALRERLAASEARGRQYALELAEKAEEIRQLTRTHEAVRETLMATAADARRIAADRLRLEEERDALRVTAEESDEIHAELAGALAVGFGEDLKPCIAPCPGHLGPKASAAVDRATVAWREKEAEAAELRRKLGVVSADRGSGSPAPPRAGCSEGAAASAQRTRD